MRLLLLLVAFVCVAQGPPPKPIPAERRLALAEAQIRLAKAQIQFQALAGKLMQQLMSSDEQLQLDLAQRSYESLLQAERTQAVAHGCDLKENWEWACPSAPDLKETPKPKP